MLNIKVAGFIFQVSSLKEEALRRRMGNYLPFELTDKQMASALGAGERVLMHLDADRSAEIPDEEPTAVFDYDITEDRASLRIYPSRYVLSIANKHTGRTFILDCPMERNSAAGEPIAVGGATGTGEADSSGEAGEASASGEAVYNFRSNLAALDVAPPKHILDHLMIFAFSAAGLPEGVLLIHSSTLVFRGRAVMCLGESGTGKSTHTRMWLENIDGAALLNDDVPAVRITDSGITVYGTPWSGKTPCYKNEDYPLAACVRIRRAPYNKLTRQSSLPAFGALLPSCLPGFQQTEATLDALCALVSEIVSRAPVYVMECLPDADAARVACTGIFG